MAAVGRKIPKEVQQIFDKYIHNFVRRLKKDDAIHMLEHEFDLNPQQAHIMFDVFDKDRNGELSIWEFQQFYSLIGENVHKILDLFKDLEKDHSGCLDIDKAWDALKNMHTETGQTLEDTDVEALLKTAAGESRSIDLAKFINLLCRLKVYKHIVITGNETQHKE